MKSVKSETHPEYSSGTSSVFMGDMLAGLPLSVEAENEIVSRAIEIVTNRAKRFCGNPDMKAGAPADSVRIIRLHLTDREHEVFACLFMDNQHRLIKFEEMFRGTIDGASVYSREVVKRALSLNCAAVIFAHNHPSGVPTPSEADKHITNRLKQALSLIDVRVLDHIIVGASEPHYYSFAEHGLI